MATEPKKNKDEVEYLSHNPELALEKTVAEILKVQKELDMMERLLNIKIQNQMSGAVADLPADALIEDIAILESAIRANIQIHDPAFKEQATLEQRLLHLQRLVHILEKRLKEDDIKRQSMEKENGLVKLDKLCKKYQDNLFTKLGGQNGDTLKRAYLNALKVPQLKEAAKGYFDHFTKVDDLRTILSIDPAYRVNHQFPAQARRKEFERYLKDNENFFMGTGASPRQFKAREGEKFHQEARKILATGVVAKEKKPRAQH